MWLANAGVPMPRAHRLIELACDPASRRPVGTNPGPTTCFFWPSEGDYLVLVGSTESNAYAAAAHQCRPNYLSQAPSISRHWVVDEGRAEIRARLP
jgi:hypothetical protein